MNGADAMVPADVKAVYSWYKKSQIDYTQHYINMYVSYNAWYRQVSGSMNDRQAIGILKKRYIIWDDYLHGKTMRTLRPYMERLAELTQREPFMSENTYWTGSVESISDWRSLIEYWYQVRCRVVHGAELSPKFIWLAYETLDVFMTEIVERMQKCTPKVDLSLEAEQDSLAEINKRRSEKFKVIQRKLHQKYLIAPDIWQIDMRRAETFT